MNLMIGLDRSQFDRKKVTFQEHITKEHNPWHYLHFIILLKEKVYTEFTGPESFVALSIEVSSNISINIYLIRILNTLLGYFPYACIVTTSALVSVVISPFYLYLEKQHVLDSYLLLYVTKPRRVRREVL